MFAIVSWQCDTLRSNFGHLFGDDFVPAFMAMELFGSITRRNRLLLMPGSSCVPSSVIENTNPWSYRCKLAYRIWVKALSQSEAATQSMYSQSQSSVCFKKVIVGHSSALSFSYMNPSRGPSVRRFRNFFAANLNLSALYARAPRIAMRRHRINLYHKSVSLESDLFVHRQQSYTWPDVCMLLPALTRALGAEVEVKCVVLESMDLSLQIETVASASIHIVPHGGLSYALIFARDGASAVVLTHGGGKDMAFIPYLTWLKVLYISRQSVRSLFAIIADAIVDASIALRVPLPDIDSLPLDASHIFRMHPTLFAL
jgi:hypothetical protein